jgi:hypothetical protein
MLLSRKIAGEFVAVFLIGVVVGGLVVWDLVVWNYPADSELTKFMAKSNDPDSLIVQRINQKYVTEYHLTPEEIEKIQPLVKAMAQQTSHVRHQFGADIISIFTEYHDKIAAQLTPEHREAYEKASVTRKKQLSELLKLEQAASSDQGQK